MYKMSSTKNIYAIYAKQDKEVLQYLLFHLQPLEKDHNVAIWSDDAINPGQRWKPRHVSRLDHADVFLLLLSNAFMYSEFIRQDEFKMVLDRFKEGRAFVIPILLDDCPWDVEFTFNDYTFNFRELQVFRKYQKPIGEWKPTDEIFKHVAYYVRGLLSSPIKKGVLEESANEGEEKMLNARNEGQIAIEFFEEREVNNEAERERKQNKQGEAKKRIEKNSQLEEEAEAKEVMIKEKRLRQKADIQKRIEKEVEAKRVVQEQMREHEVVKALLALEEKRRGELEKVARENQHEKSLEEITAPQKRVPNKNGLARYNYQFSTATVVEARRVVKEERRGSDEAQTARAKEKKGRGEITKSPRATEREKSVGETTASPNRVTKKGLARYNYRFNTPKVVEAKGVVEEEKRGNEEAKPKTAVGEKRRGEITKSQKGTAREKGLGDIVVALKGAMKKNRAAVQNFKVKNTAAIHEFFKEAKAKTVAGGKRRGEETKSQKGTVREKGFGEIVAALKAVMKKNRSALQNFKVKNAAAIYEFFKEAKARTAAGEKHRGEITKTQKGTARQKRFGEIVAALKAAMKKNRTALQNFQIKNAAIINQFFQELKKNISTKKIRRIRSEWLIAALVIVGILVYMLTGSSEPQSTTVSQIEEAEVDSDTGVNTSTNPENQEAAISQLEIGDRYQGGIVFAIDPSNKTGKIASLDDEGPMIWNNAINIHEKLGEGWRLPTLDELRLIYKNIGQGADNKGGFADELYWSATPFDDNQARLLRFSDGNASYHYNSSGTFRKFRVRAIQDFKQ